MFGAYSPALTIELVQLGIDVFDTTYAYLAASNNLALTFNFDVDTETDVDLQFAIDLTDTM